MSVRALRSLGACAVLLAAGTTSGCRGGQWAAAAGSAAGTPAPPLPTLAAFIPPSRQPDPARVALGRLLFFDVRLSGDRTTSCATCHDPAKGFTDGHAKAHGKGGKVLRRNTPSVVNIDGRAPMFWDGRAATAEDQALMPVKNPDEMARDLPSLIAELQQTPEYLARFKRAFGDWTIDGDRIARAVADFERTLVSAGAPLDRYLGGDAAAMSPAAVRGMKLFTTSRAGCVKCHSGPQLTDGSFHNIGLPGVAADPGRYEVVPIAVSRGAFKTPGLRDVALTAPYFHDGSAATLRDVVDHYKRGGVVKDNLDADIKPLPLTDADEDDLIAFMRALTGASRPTEAPRIPVSRPRPAARSVRDLMQTNDRTLRQIDPAGTGSAASGLRSPATAASARALVEAAEQIPILLGSRPDVRARRRELDERVGELIVALSDLRERAEQGQTDEMTAAYDQVRDRCEACHERFRWAHGARERDR